MEVYDFGLRLKELRIKRRLSQVKAAELLGVSRATISACERNTKNPSLDLIKHMAILYNCSVDYMLGFENRQYLYLDDLKPSQQETMIDIIEKLKSEFKKN